MSQHPSELKAFSRSSIFHGKSKSQLRACAFRRRALIKPLEFHFWTPYSSLRTINAPKKRAARLVGHHSSILVDPFFARGLATK
jgi:hypothetical protein